MTPMKMEFNSETGELTIFVGAVRESLVIVAPDHETATEKALQLFRLCKFAYSQGVRDADRLLQQKSASIFDELILER